MRPTVGASGSTLSCVSAVAARRTWLGVRRGTSDLRIKKGPVSDGRANMTMDDLFGGNPHVQTVWEIRRLTGYTDPYGFNFAQACVEAYDLEDSMASRELAVLYFNGAIPLLHLPPKMTSAQWIEEYRRAERRRLTGGRELTFRRKKFELLLYAHERGALPEPLPSEVQEMSA